MSHPDRHGLIAYLRLLGGTHAEAVQHDELPGDGDWRPTSKPIPEPIRLGGGGLHFAPHPDPDDDEDDDFFAPEQETDDGRTDRRTDAQ